MLTHVQAARAQGSGGVWLWAPESPAVRELSPCSSAGTSWPTVGTGAQPHSLLLQVFLNLCFLGSRAGSEGTAVLRTPGGPALVKLRI